MLGTSMVENWMKLIQSQSHSQLSFVLLGGTLFSALVVGLVFFATRPKGQSAKLRS